MHRTFDRHPTPQNKKEALKRAIDLEMSAGDIGHFVGVAWHVAQQNMERYGRKRDFACRPIKRLFRGSALTYRASSQIYEAKDLDFTRDEIAELLGLDNKIVDYALRNRRKIGGKIKDALKILYPERKSNKPYLERFS